MMTLGGARNFFSLISSHRHKNVYLTYSKKNKKNINFVNCRLHGFTTLYRYTSIFDLQTARPVALVQVGIWNKHINFDRREE